MAPLRLMSRLARPPAGALGAFLPVALALGLCPLVAALASRDPVTAVAHARTCAALEQRLGLHFEPALVRWLHRHAALWTLAGLYYLGVHLPAAVGALVWVWCERRDAFVRARDTFVIAQLLTVVGYLLVPTAPPSMLTVAQAHRAVHGQAVYLLQSPFAAMPSGHIVFALFAAMTVTALARPRLVRGVALVYPLLTLMVILATGNHLWLDAAGGAGVLGLAFAGARALEAWRGHRAGAPARMRAIHVRRPERAPL